MRQFCRPAATDAVSGQLSHRTNQSTSTVLTEVVNRATLTVTALSANRTFAGTEFTATGLTNGDGISGVTLASIGAANTATTVTYPIVASAATGSGLGNDTNSYVNGNLTVGAPTPVTINPPVLLADGTVQLTFTGSDAGASYRIQSSLDLNSTNWTTLGTSLATTNGLPGFIDADAPNHPARYYRTATP